jgi:hypothetical protein
LANSQWVTYLFFIRALTCKTHNDRMFPLKTADDISLYYLLQNSGIEDDYTKLKLLKDVLCIYSSHTYESENYFPSLWLFQTPLWQTARLSCWHLIFNWSRYLSKRHIWHFETDKIYYRSWSTYSVPIQNFLPFRSTWVYPQFLVGFVLLDL